MRRIFYLAAFLSSLCATRAHATCTPTRMLMVVDKSSSMTETVDGTGKSKWTLAVEAITQVANTFENKIDLGINIFPNPSQCAPGKTLVEPGPGHASAIIASLGAAPPTGGNYTPMAQSIDVAANDALLADASRRPSILLVTDGWQWCSPYDASTRTWPIDSVKNAKMKGIKVYVVGFGASVDVWTLNQMAQAAGTALPGCDPTGTVSGPKNCYYQADSGAALSAALSSISVTVSTEICDGLDNDCDGQIDENLVRACSTSCGSGTQTCNAGTWSGCNAPSASTEICDGKDNDCDGLIDEGCACTPGSTSSCGGGGLGICNAAGTQTCLPNGQWGPCVGAGTPKAELCNGIDDDCNGLIDDGDPATMCPDGFCGDDNMCHSNSEIPPPAAGPMSVPTGCEALNLGCTCVTGTVVSCAPITKGACAFGGGTQTCNGLGNWDACIPAVQPRPESCNGSDDDCNGVVDDGDVCADGASFGDGLDQRQPERGCSVVHGAPGGTIAAMALLILLALGATRRRIARSPTKR
jgi:MYXO-CTERM domain-containing protein